MVSTNFRVTIVNNPHSKINATKGIDKWGNKVYI